MATFDTLAPFILRYETGANITAADTPQTAFSKAVARGVTTLPGDRGGATCCGVILQTFRTFTHNPNATPADLARLDYPTWRAIAKGIFWDKCLADQIAHQGTANMIVDWAYTAGLGNTIPAVQRALNTAYGAALTVDGIIGSNTLRAINAPGRDPLDTFRVIKAARQDYYRRIATRGSNARFLRGWLNRTEAITPSSLRYR